MKWLFAGAVFFISLLLAANFASAWSVSSANYNITGVLPDAGSRIDSTNYVLDVSAGQPIAGDISSTNYKLCIGYQCKLADVKLTKTYVSDSSPLENDGIKVYCNYSSSVQRANCINASIGGQVCTWNDNTCYWEDEFTAVFVDCKVGSAGSKEVKCFIQRNKCDQIGPNQTTTINVRSSDCSGYTTQATCPTDICEWCPWCSGKKSNGLEGNKCIPAGTCSYACKNGECGATCDGSVGCPNKCVDNTRYYSGSCDSTSCSCSWSTENCNNYDGWYNKGSSYSCCDGNNKCTCQDQEYRDYTCSAGSCSYSVTNTQTVKSSCVACRTDAEDSDNGQLFTTKGTCTDYTGCSGGSCQSTAYTDYCLDSKVREYYVSGSTCAYTDKSCGEVGTGYICSDGACVSQCIGKTDGTSCGTNMYCCGKTCVGAPTSCPACQYIGTCCSGTTAVCCNSALGTEDSLCGTSPCTSYCNGQKLCSYPAESCNNLCDGTGSCSMICDCGTLTCSYVDNQCGFKAIDILISPKSVAVEAGKEVQFEVNITNNDLDSAHGIMIKEPKHNRTDGWIIWDVYTYKMDGVDCSGETKTIGAGVTKTAYLTITVPIDATGKLYVNVSAQGSYAEDVAVITISVPRDITFKGALTEAGKPAAGISFTATVYNESFDPKSYSASGTTEPDGNFTVTITGIPQEFVKAGFYIKMSSVGKKVEAEYICRYEYDPITDTRKCTKV